jgi:hypothetical protein
MNYFVMAVLLAILVGAAIIIDPNLPWSDPP